MKKRMRSLALFWILTVTCCAMVGTIWLANVHMRKDNVDIYRLAPDVTRGDQIGAVPKGASQDWGEMAIYRCASLLKD
jgi:hypothetical protein